MGPRFNGVEDATNRQDAILALCASMGPRFNGVEDHRLEELLLRYFLGASMGPRFNGVEDPRTGNPRAIRRSSFNGATL